MNAGMIIIGLVGLAYCSYQVYDAWCGGGHIPFGAIFGGALGGMGGAMVGSAVAGDSHQKKKPKTNWGGLIFWIVVALPWLGIMIAGFVGE